MSFFLSFLHDLKSYYKAKMQLPVDMVRKLPVCTSGYGAPYINT